MHNHILGKLWKLLWALLENCWKNYGALECLNYSEQWFHYISAKTQTLQSRYHMTMDCWRKMSPTIATKKLSRSEDRKNQGPTTRRRPRKNLHAQPVGKPKVCTTPCLTPTSTDGQTLLEVMPMTIVQERLPLPMPPTTQYQAARRNKSCVHPHHTKTENSWFQKSYTTNAKQLSPVFTFLLKNSGGGALRASRNSVTTLLAQLELAICSLRLTVQ